MFLIEPPRRGQRAIDDHSDPSGITLRRATDADAEAIGAVFDAATRSGQAFLEGLADEPMFSPDDWHQLVSDHTDPTLLLVATDVKTTSSGTPPSTRRKASCSCFSSIPHTPAAASRMLLAAARDAFWSGRRNEAFVYAHEQNRRALAVYRRAGYRPDGTMRESDFRGTRLREVRLVKQRGDARGT